MAKALSSMVEYDDSTLLLVDSLNLAFRWGHKGIVHYSDEYLKTVDSFRKSFKAGKVLVLADWGGSAYRKSIYPEYKIARKEKQALATEDEQIQFQLFFEEYEATLEEFKTAGKYPVLRYKGVEADDLAAFITKKAAKYGITKVVLLSSDRDWDLLLAVDSDVEVSRFSYVTRKEISVDNYSEHYNWYPDEYISIKCLQGDSGDSVPGVDGVGPVKALELVRKYGSASEVAANIPIASKYKYVQKVNEFGCDNILRNYQLMDLLEFCEEAMGTEVVSQVTHTMETYLC